MGDDSAANDLKFIEKCISDAIDSECCEENDEQKKIPGV